MRKQDWKQQTYALQWLRERRFDFDPSAKAPVFEWLRAIGVVPADMTSIAYGRVNPVLNLNPEAIKAHYIAAVAYEWDSWGPSSPTQFLDALELETAGHVRRDTIAETLTALGRAIAEDSQEEVTYRLRLPKGHAA